MHCHGSVIMRDRAALVQSCVQSLAEARNHADRLVEKWTGILVEKRGVGARVGLGQEIG
ncbi:hypothetical protein SVIOM74S_00344 [Streptomyces violarus]